jgi:hypothetical protein
MKYPSSLLPTRDLIGIGSSRGGGHNHLPFLLDVLSDFLREYWYWTSIDDVYRGTSDEVPIKLGYTWCQRKEKHNFLCQAVIEDRRDDGRLIRFTVVRERQIVAEEDTYLDIIGYRYRTSTSPLSIPHNLPILMSQNGADMYANPTLSGFK